MDLRIVNALCGIHPADGFQFERRAAMSWATPEQVESYYPGLPEFLELKRAYDPEARFQSDWYLHYPSMFS